MNQSGQDAPRDWRRPTARRRAALLRVRAAGRRLPGHLVRLRLRDDRRDADHPARAVRDPEEHRDGVRAHVPRLQLQVAVGAVRRHRPHSDARPLRPAPIVAVVRGRAGHGGGHVSRRHRSGDGAARGRGRSRAGRVRRRHLRHRHRRVPDRAARATTAGRRLGHVAIRLADRRRVGRRAGAGDRRALRLGRGVCGLCAVRAAGDARRRGHGRTGAPPATRAARERPRLPSWPISARSPSSCGARARWSC